MSGQVGTPLKEVTSKSHFIQSDSSNSNDSPSDVQDKPAKEIVFQRDFSFSSGFPDKCQNGAQNNLFIDISHGLIPLICKESCGCYKNYIVKPNCRCY